MTLQAVTTPAADGSFVVPEGWHQGRATFGGFVVATLIRAAEAKVGDPARTVRTISAQLYAPLPVGAHRVEVEVLRAGNSVTIARASIAGYAHAVATLATTRPAAAGWQDLAVPQLPPHSAVPAMPTGGPAPEFTQHFEYRQARGAIASGETEIAGWLRARDPGTARDAAYLAAMADAWWPVGMARMATVKPMSTLSFTLDIVSGLHGLSPDAPLLYRATAPVCADGYCLETRELWGEDGRLVAVNQQTMVVFG